MIINAITRWLESFSDYKIGAWYSYDYEQFNELVNYHIGKTIVLLFVIIFSLAFLLIGLVRNNSAKHSPRNIDMK